jgi:hypothetical protein
MEKKIVWEFTNQRKLTKSEFLDYFEKKLFKTIRKYNMLPKNKTFQIKKSNNLNTKILEHILKTKFQFKYTNQENISDENMSKLAEDIFNELINGKFIKHSPEKKPFKPLYFFSDKEIELYSELKNIKGKSRKKHQKTQDFFNKFLKKNPDLEISILNASNQLKD